MESKWIKTEEMLEMLRNNPNQEQEYRHLIGGFFVTTHWLVYDSNKNMFKDSMELSEYAWYTEEELLKEYKNHWWHRDA